MSAWDEFAVHAQQFGAVLSAAQSAQFAAYEALLLDWNGRMNLTAIREPAQIRTRHFLDALSCVQVVGDLNGRSLIDIGTGAGFPGLPLKIIYPELHLTLVESVQKKTRFLQAVVDELGLASVQIVAERAETLGQMPAFREQYDWAVARAVAEMRVLVELLLPFCRVGGHMLAQKGESAEGETAAAANAIGQLGGQHVKTVAVQLPEREEPHFLIVIAKQRAAPKQFPRRAGLPGKRPL